MKNEIAVPSALTHDAVGQRQAQVARHAAQGQVGQVGQFGARDAVVVALHRHADEHRDDGAEHADDDDHDHRFDQREAALAALANSDRRHGELGA